MTVRRFSLVCLLLLFIFGIATCDDGNGQTDTPEANDYTESVLDSDAGQEQPTPVTEEKKDCRLSSLRLQPDFSLIRFQGYWYSLSTNKYWMTLPSWLPLSQKNIQTNYKLLSDGTMELKTAGSYMFSFCDYGLGKGTIPDKSQPQKLQVQFDSVFSKAARKNPHWVVSTDYDGYAVMYSCTKEREDGTCDTDHAYMWTLNRKRGGHTPAQLMEIDKAAKDMCIPPGEFKTFTQDGNCKFDPNNFPSVGLGIVPFLIIASVMCIVTGILCFFCVSKIDKEAEQKKKTQ